MPLHRVGHWVESGSSSVVTVDRWQRPWPGRCAAPHRPGLPAGSATGVGRSLDRTWSGPTEVGGEIWLTAAGCGGRRRAGWNAGALRAGEAQLLGGAARGSGLGRPVLVLPQPGVGVGQRGQLGEQGELLLVLGAADEAGGGQQHGGGAQSVAGARRLRDAAPQLQGGPVVLPGRRRTGNPRRPRPHRQRRADRCRPVSARWRGPRPRWPAPRSGSAPPAYARRGDVPPGPRPEADRLLGTGQAPRGRIRIPLLRGCASARACSAPAPNRLTRCATTSMASIRASTQSPTLGAPTPLSSPGLPRAQQPGRAGTALLARTA